MLKESVLTSLPVLHPLEPSLPSKAAVFIEHLLMSDTVLDPGAGEQSSVGERPSSAEPA